MTSSGDKITTRCPRCGAEVKPRALIEPKLTLIRKRMLARYALAECPHCKYVLTLE